MKQTGLGRGFLLSAIAITVLVLTVRPAQATVYSAHSEYVSRQVWLTVDTTADTLWFKWSAPEWGIQYYYWGSYIHVWDDYGRIYWYDAPLGTHIPGNGEKTFAYTMNWVNVHAEVRWCYQLVGHYFGVPITVGCHVYVENGPGGGGGHETCPTLFTWNGTDYMDYGVIPIHDPTGEDMVTEVPVLAEDVDISNSKAKFRLREGWPGLEFSESVIDQVKLYAVNEEGEQNLCPLISAEHSRLGNVLPQLLFSDDVRVETHVLETIDLAFVVPHRNVEGFTFVIEGCNWLKP
jgi:hypothetical protein